MNANAIHDAVIVGAGPAGLSAALILGRARRRVLVFDSGQNRNTASRAVHGYLTRDGVRPAEFHALARNELSHYRSVRIQAASVRSVESDPGPHRNGSAVRFRVTLEGGGTFLARKVLLATGVKDFVPDIPGFRELYGRSVFLCPYCDGWEARDRPIAVYGQKKRGPEFALTMTRWSRDLVLCSDGRMAATPEEIRCLRAYGVRVIEKRIERLEGRGRLERIVFSDGSAIARQALFFNTGKVQRSEFGLRLGCRFGRNGGILVDERQATRVPGVYAAGDACEGLKMAIVAAAQGATAGFAMNGALLDEDIAVQGRQRAVGRWERKS